MTLIEQVKDLIARVENDNKVDNGFITLKDNEDNKKEKEKEKDSKKADNSKSGVEQFSDAIYEAIAEVIIEQ